MILEFPKSIKIKADSLENIKKYFIQFKNLEETVNKTNIIIAEIEHILKLIETIHIWKTNKKRVGNNLKLIKDTYSVLQLAYNDFELNDNIAANSTKSVNYKNIFIYTNSKSEEIKNTFNLVYDYKIAHYIYIDLSQITIEEAYNFGLHYEDKNTYYTNLSDVLTIGISAVKVKTEEKFISLVKRRGIK